MDPVALFSKAVLLPALLCGLLLGGAHLAPARIQPLLGALAVALAWMVGGSVVLGALPWPPVEAPHFLLLLGAPAVLTGLLPPAAGHGLRALLAAAAVYGMSEPKRAYAWEGATGPLWLALGVGLMLGAWVAVDAAARRRPPAASALPVALTAALGAMALGATGSVVYGQLGGVLATALGLVAASTLRSPLAPWSRAALAVGTPAVVGMLLAGAWFSELPAGAAVLLGLAPIAALAPKAEGRLPVGPLALSLLLALGGLGWGLAEAGMGSEVAPAGMPAEPW